MARPSHRRPSWPAFALVGIRRRGVPLASKIRDVAACVLEDDILFGELTLKRYADDLSLLHEHPKMDEPDLPFDVNGRSIVLVDHVAYTGRTLLAASSHLLASGAARVFAAALCDRGGREAPVSAEFIGLRLDVGPDHVVDVHIPPYESDLAVAVKPRTASGD